MVKTREIQIDSAFFFNDFDTSGYFNDFDISG